MNIQVATSPRTKPYPNKAIIEKGTKTSGRLQWIKHTGKRTNNKEQRTKEQGKTKTGKKEKETRKKDKKEKGKGHWTKGIAESNSWSILRNNLLNFLVVEKLDIH